MKRNLLIVLILGIFLFSVWSIPRSSSITTLEEEDESSHERDIQVEYSDFQLRYQSELKNGSVKDVINVEVDVQSNYPDDNVSGQTEIRFKYKQEATSETQFTYRVELLNLIEYVENGTEWGYQSYEHLSDYSVGGTGWHPIAYTFDNSSGGEIHIFNLTTADDVVSIIIRVSGLVFNMGNATLTPNTLKMDILVNDFPYTDENASLAFHSKVKTSVEAHKNDDTFEEGQGTGNNESELQMNINGTTGFFSWAETAIIDGITSNVIASPVSLDDTDSDLGEGEHANEMYFSFNATHSSSIIWDPKLGVVTNDLKVPNTPSSTPTSVTSTDDTNAPPASSNPKSDVIESTADSSLPFSNIYIIGAAFVSLSLMIRRRL